MNFDDWQLGLCFLENKNPAVPVKLPGASTYHSKRALISSFSRYGMHSAMGCAVPAPSQGGSGTGAARSEQKTDLGKEAFFPLN